MTDVSSAPAGYRFPREVIAVAVRWYLRYGLSYRDVEELLAERGIEVDHITVCRLTLRACAVKSRPPPGVASRSSCTGGPALRFRPRFFQCSDQIRCSEQSRCTRFSPALMPCSGGRRRRGDTRNSGAPAWISSAALIRCASAQSRSVPGLFFHR
jgi:hypothetical protein